MKLNKYLSAYIQPNGKLAWKEPSILIVWMYYILNRNKSLFNKVLFTPPYYFLSILTGINIPKTTTIGNGLRIHHYGCIIINSYSRIGNNCTIRHEVTIGNKNSDKDCPIIGNNCNIGAGAKILGSIKIGNNVDIGANAVVITDVPDNCIAVGVPAKIIRKNEKTNKQDYQQTER